VLGVPRTPELKNLRPSLPVPLPVLAVYEGAR
jgi:hypothetical protein